MPRSRRSRGTATSTETMAWRRMDLHVHTPATKDYQEAGATYLDILKKAEAEGLDIIAFTDHNTVAGYARMTLEIEDLERWDAAGRLHPEEHARLEEYRRLRSRVLVLPGFELTATFGFHILGVFDASTPVRVLEHLLLKLNVPAALLDAGETEVGATSDVLSTYRLLSEAGALVIAAHANSSHGVAMFGFDFGGQTKIAYTQDPNLNALEVTDLESGKRRTTASFFNGSKPEYPRRMHCIQGSDAHRVRGVPGNRQNLGVGERATEVLLPEVSFAALKELFASSGFSRTRPYQRTAEAFDYVDAARQEGPSIVQSFHEQMTRQSGRLHAVVRDVVAYANTNGGTIFVGTKGDLKSLPRGVDQPDDATRELLREVQRLITPPIEVGITVLPSHGKNVLRVTVPKGDDPPYVMEGNKIFLRKETETSPALRDEIVALVQRAALPEMAPVASTSEQSRSAPIPEPEPETEDEQLAPPRTESPVTDMPAPEDHPRTGVEIVDSQVRDGVLYHTMRDLRNGDEVHNVTRASAHRLWRYAIALKEKHTFQENKVRWLGERGLWHKYLRAGRAHYDLVQRDANGNVHVYYGVTEDGTHGPWKAVVGTEE